MSKNKCNVNYYYINKYQIAINSRLLISILQINNCYFRYKKHLIYILTLDNKNSKLILMMILYQKPQEAIDSQVYYYFQIIYIII